MPIFGKILFYLLCFVVCMPIIKTATAQQCSGSWAVGTSLNWGCISGVSINSNNNSEPTGCPINPIYLSLQTNTFTFDQPVETLMIDFRGFSSLAGCARMEIKVNGVFYPLTFSNIMDIPSAVGCTGSYSYITLSPEGYITSTSTSLSTSNGQGRILISGVNASSVTISTNDPAGTIVSAPFSCTIVPLKLEKFTGNSSECKASLKWKTGTEFNVKNIEIERSENAVVFNKVGEVIPKGSESDYTFVASNNSAAYFRLKINDLDGHYEYSKTIHLASSCDKAIYSIIPNPASSQVEISGLKSTDNIIVYDLMGKTVMRYNTLPGNKMNTQSLPAGMYFIQVYNSGLSKACLKLIRN